MGNHYSVKVCINQRFDHYSGGRELYKSILTRANQPTFNPFDEWWQHRFISSKWDLKRNKINSITLLFIKRTINTRQVKYIISMKVKNCNVIEKYGLDPNLTFLYDYKTHKFDENYYNLIHTKMFK